MLSRACPKPARGTLRAQRDEKRQHRLAHEQREKAAVRARDGNVCRWPGCLERTRLECAHVVSKSLGGSSERGNMIRLCEGHHRGPCSLHSGDLRVEPVTVAGTNGPCLFLRADEQRGWVVVQVEEGAP